MCDFIQKPFKDVAEKAIGYKKQVSHEKKKNLRKIRLVVKERNSVEKLKGTCTLKQAEKQETDIIENYIYSIYGKKKIKVKMLRIVMRNLPQKVSSKS